MRKPESKDNFVVKINEQYQALFLKSNIRSKVMVALRMLMWVGPQTEATREVLISIISVIRNTLDGKGSNLHDVEVFSKYFSGTAYKLPYVVISSDGVLRLARPLLENEDIYYQAFCYTMTKEHVLMFLAALEEFASKD